MAGDSPAVIQYDINGNPINLPIGTSSPSSLSIVGGIDDSVKSQSLRLDGYNLKTINDSIATNNSAIPTKSTIVSGYDGTNARLLKLFDLDSGGGTDYNLGTNLRISSSGGSIEAKGQQLSALSLPVVIASDQSSLPITIGSSGYGGQVEGRAGDGYAPVGYPVLFGGYDGSLVKRVLTDSVGRIITAPAGTVSTTSGFGCGYVVTAVIALASVRATTYTEQTTNAQRSIVSASANDISGGTGARTVILTYYDQSGNGPYYETITLNGTTAVNTVNTNICFIEDIVVSTVGSNTSNAGIISLKSTTGGGGVTIGSIAVGDNQTYWAHHYVPNGKTAYITGISVGHSGTTAGSGGIFTLRAKSLGSDTVDLHVSDFVRLYGQSSTVSRNYGTAIKVTGPARITMYILPETSSSVTYRGSFDFYDQ